MPLAAPESPDALASELAGATARKQPVETGGAFTKTRWGGPRPENALTLTTRELKRILAYEPRDLTISVEAGLPWRELTETLAANRQMIPLDPPFADRATVGGVIATNASGPRRRLHGTARDLVIGMTYATAEGKLIQSGGMVVKNVAGLDTGKLQIGALGTLGVITSVNFKLLPMPVETRTFARSFATAGEAMAARDLILRGQLQPMALDLLNPAAASGFGLSGYCLLLEAGGNSSLLDRYQRELPGFEAISGDIWRRITSYPEQYLDLHPGGAIVRVSSVLSELGTVASHFPGPLIARAATGVSYAFCERMPEEFPPFRCVVEAASEPRPEGRALWPNPPGEVSLMERIKDMMDRERILNPGRFHGRL